MDISLRAERSAPIAPTTRMFFSCAAILALSSFARDTAKAIPAFVFPFSAASSTAQQADLQVVRPAEVLAPLGTPAPVLAPAIRPNPFKRIKSGLASWYGAVLQDHRTASGKRFNMYELTAAHRDLPFGSKVKVTDLRSHRSVIVTITDRGVLNDDRIIDLSYEAARQLQMIKSGVDPVTLDLLTARNAPVPAF